MENIKEISNQEDTVTKRKVVNSVKWSAIERYSSQGIQFIVSIVMARLLTPAEYGVVGIISVFIGFSEIFINSGISSALITKKDCSNYDYCTANWINIIISIICYAILFFCAPSIAKFYDMPILIPGIRIMTLCFVTGSISATSRVILAKELKFRQTSLITLSTSIISGIAGIIMAYMGMGVWALIYQTIITSTFSSVIIICVSRFYPKPIMSRTSFINLMRFGSKLLLNDILYSIYSNIYPLLIGKGFSVQSVGYFNRASSYSGLLTTNVAGVLDKVLFPIYAKLQNDDDKLKNMYEKSLTITSLFVISGSFFLMGLAKPLITVMITTKWLPCVPLLQILCLDCMFSHIISINGRVLLAKSHPTNYLLITLISKPLSLIIILISYLGGIYALAWSKVFISLLTTIISCIIFYRSTYINPLKCLKHTFGIITVNVFITIEQPKLIRNIRV